MLQNQNKYQKQVQHVYLCKVDAQYTNKYLVNLKIQFYKQQKLFPTITIWRLNMCNLEAYEALSFFLGQKRAR